MTAASYLGRVQPPRIRLHACAPSGDHSLAKLSVVRDLVYFCWRLVSEVL